jgi:hypothetical protein
MHAIIISGKFLAKDAKTTGIDVNSSFSISHIQVPSLRVQLPILILPRKLMWRVGNMVSWWKTQ